VSSCGDKYIVFNYTSGTVIYHHII
jgi:hypothetical protein